MRPGRTALDEPPTPGQTCRMLVRLKALFTVTFVAGFLVLAPSTATATFRSGYGYRSWLRGSPADVHPTTTPGAMLEGGRSDRNHAWDWFLDHAGYGDIVVICSTCDAIYNSYVYNLHAVDSVQTLKITKRLAAFDPFVTASVSSADGIFIAGGDQSDYVRVWKDTPVAAAIDEAVAAGRPIGGISAGLAVLGQYAFGAEKNTIVSRKALSNCFNRKITLEKDMLAVPQLTSTITDSHFSARDRTGRLLTFLARTIRDGWTSDAKGIGVDEDTAALVDADGNVHVVGEGAAWFLRLGSSDVTTCEPGQPLTSRFVPVSVIDKDATFDLASWTGSERATILVRADHGVLERLLMRDRRRG
jgi:cyanophycinase